MMLPLQFKQNNMGSESFYKLFIDPLLNKVHSRAAGMIPDGSNIIDIACGNGTLALKSASGTSQVTGIDLSPESISYARKRAQKAGRSKLQFIEMDASDLSRFTDKQFDYSTISMAVHQFAPDTATHILKEMTRISSTIVVIDYAYPQPKGFAGLVVRFMERMAGTEHNRNFKAYLELGGICEIAKELGLSAEIAFGGIGHVFVIATLK